MIGQERNIKDLNATKRELLIRKMNELAARGIKSVDEYTKDK